MHGHVSKRSLTIRDVSKYSLTVVSTPLLYGHNNPPLMLGRGAVVGATLSHMNLTKFYTPYAPFQQMPILKKIFGIFQLTLILCP
jgi:hypothetical protein